MKGIKFIPSETRIRFIRFRMISFVVSGLLMLASIGLFFTTGLNYGIDFRGGTLIEVRNKTGPVDLSDMRVRLSNLGLGDVQIQEFGAPSDVLIRIEQQKGGEQKQQNAIEKIKETLGDSVDYRRIEVVGPTVSGELIQSGAIAVVVAIFSVLVYIWFRFEWQFSVGAVAALVHDVALTIGLFCLLQVEFGLSIIAAILTIVGYSLNDTVVVFDRVRENLRKFKKMPLPELLDRSINDTLSRTILTSVTTLVALLSLYTFGGQVIRGFTFAMIWGVFVGTYSSVFVASPLLLMLGVKRGWSGTGGAKVKEPASSPRQ
ncbi:MAG: protein translocase subunit SecF [Alphaproteobacteria bacterium]